MKSIPVTRKYFLIILTTLLSSSVAAQQVQETKPWYEPDDDSLTAFIEIEMQKWKIPGLALGVIRNGNVIRESYYGYANLDHKVSVSEHSVFPIASVDKQLTATCILMLAGQNRLTLDDPISAFLDSLPSAWQPVQIKHLLSHTSGIPDEAFERYRDKAFLINTTEEIFENIKRQTLLHPPGERFLYSDAGFFLLNLIIERASGLPYEAYLKKHVFDPLEMAHTAVINPFRVRSGKVTSYYRNYSGSGDSVQVNIGRACDNGPLYNDLGTTLPDFVKYAKAMEQHRLVSGASYELMWTPFVTNGGREISELEDGNTLFDGHASYGYGWELQRFGSRRIVYHGGFTGVSLTKIPEDGLTIILLTNLTDPFGFRANRLARQIAAHYVPECAPFGTIGSIDRRPKTTAFILNKIEQINAGNPDASAFSEEFFRLMRPSLSDYHRKIGRMGKLLEWKYLSEESESAGQRTLYYLARYELKDLYYRVVLDKKQKQKITAITIY